MGCWFMSLVAQGGGISIIWEELIPSGECVGGRGRGALFGERLTRVEKKGGGRLFTGGLFVGGDGGVAGEGGGGGDF